MDDRLAEIRMEISDENQSAHELIGMVEDLRSQLAALSARKPGEVVIREPGRQEIHDYIEKWSDDPCVLGETLRGFDAGVSWARENAEAVAPVVVLPELTGEEIEKHLHETMPPQAGLDPDQQATEWCYKDCRWAYNLARSRIRTIGPEQESKG